MLRNILLLTLVLCLSQTNTFAQSKPKQAVVYDIVHLKTGKVLYGEIIEFNQKDGDLTFRDNYNRNYSLSREMYDYFEENVTYNKRIRDTLVKPRKTDEFSFMLGLTQFAAGTDNGFVADDYYLISYGSGYYFDLPICMSVGAGKYLSRQHFVGLKADVKLLSSLTHFYSIGANYQFQYDGMKSNVAKYIPIRLNYGVRSSDEWVNIQDPTMPPFSNYIQKQFDVNMSSLGIEFGHGFSFIGNNKHSWNLEFCFFKNMVLSQTITPVPLGAGLPNFNYSQAGAKLSLSFNF
ncbi:MAG: hypothetical protein RLZZ585_1620 [Bacteroidota bacterium]|jgi:hypothetical protein